MSASLLQYNQRFHSKTAAVVRKAAERVSCLLHFLLSVCLSSFALAQSEWCLACSDFRTMKLVALVCLCLVTRCGITAAGVNGQEVVKVFAAEGSDVILPCSLSPKENIQSELFDWKKVPQKNEGQKEVFLYDKEDKYNSGRSGQSQTFKGRVSHFPDQLKYGNASITITNTKETDSGNYTCEFPRLQPDQKFYIELIFGAAPDPFITTLGPTEDGALLQCRVQGASPEPRLQWQDSDGNILPAEEPQVSERGGSYDVILQVTVTKTDRYRCVATQETIYHQIYTETYLSVNADGSEGNSESPTGWVGIVAAVLGGVLFLVVVGGVLLAVLVYKFVYLPLKLNEDGEKRGHQNTNSVPEVVPLTTTPPTLTSS